MAECLAWEFASLGSGHSDV